MPLMDTPPEPVQLGELIQRRRFECRMKQRDLARAVGSTPSYISHVEHGRTSVSIQFLHKIATALQVPIAYFFQADASLAEAEEGPEPARPRRDVQVVHPHTRKVLVDPLQRNIKWELLSPDHQRKMEFLLLSYQPGAHLAQMTHEGEECGMVLEGSLEVIVEGEVKPLGPGDSIYFECSRPHEVRNPSSDRVARAVWVISPPSF